MAALRLSLCPASSSSLSCLSMSTACGGGGSVLLLNDSANSKRVEFLKKRFAGLIEKAKKTLDGESTEKNREEGEGCGSCRVTNRVRRMNNNNIAAADGTRRNRENHVKNNNSVNVVMADGMRKKRKEERKNKTRKMEIQRMREEARRKIEQMRNTSGICDPQEVTNEFEKLIGYESVMGHTQWPPGLFFFSRVQNDEEEEEKSLHSSSSREVEEGEITDR